MAVITPIAPGVAGNTLAGTTPTAADSIPCSQYNVVYLIIRTGATNTYAGTIDDPTSQNPAGTLVTSGNFDIQTGTVATSSAKVIRLDCGRFRDVNGNINITSASTFAGTSLDAIGI